MDQDIKYEEVLIQIKLLYIKDTIILKEIHKAYEYVEKNIVIKFVIAERLILYSSIMNNLFLTQ